jgi:hypothetical protein
VCVHSLQPRFTQSGKHAFDIGWIFVGKHLLKQCQGHLGIMCLVCREFRSAFRFSSHLTVEGGQSQVATAVKILALLNLQS